MKLPNKVQVSKNTNVFIQDEKGSNLLVASAWISEDYQNSVIKEFTTRYNNYNKLKLALVALVVINIALLIWKVS